MPFPLFPPRCRGGFVLPLALSTAAVLLLSSLSLQTLAMHGRQRSRQLFTTAAHADALVTAEVAFSVTLEEQTMADFGDAARGAYLEATAASLGVDVSQVT